jgi:hypothetical protein
MALSAAEALAADAMRVPAATSSEATQSLIVMRRLPLSFCAAEQITACLNNR